MKELSTSKDQLLSLEEGHAKQKCVSSGWRSKSCLSGWTIKTIKFVLYVELLLFVGWACYSGWQAYQIQNMDLEANTILGTNTDMLSSQMSNENQETPREEQNALNDVFAMILKNKFLESPSGVDKIENLETTRKSVEEHESDENTYSKEFISDGIESLPNMAAAEHERNEYDKESADSGGAVEEIMEHSSPLSDDHTEDPNRVDEHEVGSMLGLSNLFGDYGSNGGGGEEPISGDIGTRPWRVLSLGSWGRLGSDNAEMLMGSGQQNIDSDSKVETTVDRDAEEGLPGGLWAYHNKYFSSQNPYWISNQKSWLRSHDIDDDGPPAAASLKRLSLLFNIREAKRKEAEERAQEAALAQKALQEADLQRKEHEEFPEVEFPNYRFFKTEEMTEVPDSEDNPQTESPGNESFKEEGAEPQTRGEEIADFENPIGGHPEKEEEVRSAGNEKEQDTWSRNREENGGNDNEEVAKTGDVAEGNQEGLKTLEPETLAWENFKESSKEKSGSDEGEERTAGVPDNFQNPDDSLELTLQLYNSSGKKDAFYEQQLIDMILMLAKHYSTEDNAKLMKEDEVMKFMGDEVQSEKQKANNGESQDENSFKVPYVFSENDDEDLLVEPESYFNVAKSEENDSLYESIWETLKGAKKEVSSKRSKEECSKTLKPLLDKLNELSSKANENGSEMVGGKRIGSLELNNIISSVTSLIMELIRMTEEEETVTDEEGMGSEEIDDSRDLQEEESTRDPTQMMFFNFDRTDEEANESEEGNSRFDDQTAVSVAPSLSTVPFLMMYHERYYDYDEDMNEKKEEGLDDDFKKLVPQPTANLSTSDDQDDEEKLDDFGKMVTVQPDRDFSIPDNQSDEDRDDDSEAIFQHGLNFSPADDQGDEKSTPVVTFNSHDDTVDTIPSTYPMTPTVDDDKDEGSIIEKETPDFSDDDVMPPSLLDEYDEMSPNYNGRRLQPNFRSGLLTPYGYYHNYNWDNVRVRYPWNRSMAYYDNIMAQYFQEKPYLRSRRSIESTQSKQIDRENVSSENVHHMLRNLMDLRTFLEAQKTIKEKQINEERRQRSNLRMDLPARLNYLHNRFSYVNNIQHDLVSSEDSVNSVENPLKFKPSNPIRINSL
ncbi:uncharacterized protein LOC105700354 [Orussus abietinus]|uniref:uncharacterized protein LOC105700354 n=1 Tax=Orussus abietinus TaxID=222816 RepID=UPI00062692F8|nr:uncharacterized protein LOC105700354 [Orussus abietinus]